MRTFLLIVCCCMALRATVALSQNKTADSLKHIFYTDKNPAKKYEAAMHLFKEFFYDKTDTAMFYFNYAEKVHARFPDKKLKSRFFHLKAYLLDDRYSLDSTIMYCDSCIALCTSKELSLQRADCFFSKGVAYFYKREHVPSAYCFKSAIPVFLANGKRKKALNGYCNLVGIYQAENDVKLCDFYFKKALEIADTTKDFSVLSNLYLNIAAVYDKANDYQKVLNYYFLSLRYAEKNGGTNVLAYGFIGGAYMNINNYPKAEKYLKKGYELAYKAKDANDIMEVAAVYALYYQNLKQFDVALQMLDTVKKFADDVNLPNASCNIYRNLAWSYTELGNYKEALYYAEKMVLIRRQTQDNNSLAEALQYLAHVYFKQGKYNEAVKIYKEALGFAEGEKNKIFIKDCYQGLARTYDEMGDYKNANEYLKKYTELNDNVTSEANAKINAELEAKYASEKKQNEIMMLNEESKFKSLELQKSNQQKSFLLIGLALLAALLMFAIYSFVQKKKANALISKQKNEVENQKQIIEEKQKEIVDSINYAKRIQYALLASADLLQKNLSKNNSQKPTHFVLFKPKDIVSGDFYWATQHKNRFYLAVCDSTGHGVPGAFMSLLNIGFLSEAIKEKEIAEPHEVFNYVRKRLIESISQENQQDGMDGILLCMDKTSGVITYAAANNSPLLVRKKEMQELPKDKMPVGKGEKNDSFKLYNVHYSEGDMLYLYTDGYADQFGGDKGKKFKYKQLNELLAKISGDEMGSQSDTLYQTFVNWKGNLEQVDDTLLIGIQL